MNTHLIGAVLLALTLTLTLTLALIQSKCTREIHTYKYNKNYMNFFRFCHFQTQK